MKRSSPRADIALALLAAISIAASPAAMAYVGPGAGLGFIGVILAVLAAIGATLFGLVLLPIRMLKQRRKAAAAAAAPEDSQKQA